MLLVKLIKSMWFTVSWCEDICHSHDNQPIHHPIRTLSQTPLVVIVVLGAVDIIYWRLSPIMIYSYHILGYHIIMLVPLINHWPPVCCSTWKSRLKWYWIYRFDIMENKFFIDFDYIFTYILMSHNMIILYFHSPYFHVSNRAIFSIVIWYSYIDVVLILSITVMIFDKNMIAAWHIFMRYFIKIYFCVKC